MANFAKIPLPIARRRDIGPAAKILLGLIAYHARGNGHAYPKTETLAAESGLAVRSVHNATAQLQTAGLILVERQHRHVNQYQLTPDLSAIFAPKAARNLGAKSALNRVQNLHTKRVLQPDCAPGTFAEAVCVSFNINPQTARNWQQLREIVGKLQAQGIDTPEKLDAAHDQHRQNQPGKPFMPDLFP